MSISKQGGISYRELGGLDIHEFFILLINYEKKLNENIKDNGRN